MRQINHNLKIKHDKNTYHIKICDFPSTSFFLPIFKTEKEKKNNQNQNEQNFQLYENYKRVTQPWSLLLKIITKNHILLKKNFHSLIFQFQKN